MPAALRNPFAVPTRLRRLQIEITTGCNLHCAGCQRSIGMAAGTWRNAHMPVARFAAILAHAPPADVAVLQGIGEPTLHPELPALIAATRGCGKFPVISFNTNALLREAGYYQALRGAGLNHVSVSVDSLDPAVAAAARSGTDCERLTAMIPALIGLFGPGVTLSIVASRLNVSGLPDLLRRLHALGGRCIEVQPLVGYGPSASPTCLTGAELTAAHRLLCETAAALPGLHLLPAAALTPTGARCRRPLHAAYVTVEGCLTPCCLTNNPALFGHADLAAADFGTLWHSTGVAGWLDAYADREPAICRGCAFNPAGVAPPTLAEAEQWLREDRLDAAEAGFRAILSRGHTAHGAAAGNAGAALPAGAAGNDALPSEALQGIGLVRLRRGDAAGALPLLQAAYALAPTARGGHNLATNLAVLGRIDDAVALQQAVLDADPDYVPAQFALGGLLAGRDDPRAAALFASLAERAIPAQRFDLVEACLARLQNFPLPADSTLRLANLLRGACRPDLARELLRPLLETDPGDIAALLVAAMSELSGVYPSGKAMAASRSAYAAALVALDTATAAASAAQLAAAFGQVGNAKPFFLAYQGEDDLVLQRRYGGILSRITRAARCPPVSAQAFRTDGRLRVGFASAYFHLHSISKLFSGWMRHLDPERFAVIGYQFGADIDATSLTLERSCAAYRRGVASDSAWAAQIAADRLDVLIYPEIGMHPLPVQLGCRRLAPVQGVAWGHPVTSGLPEIDYFLSSDLMEPEGADAHYTERLVRLPNLSIAYAPLPDDGATLPRASLGLREDAVVYVCCQSLPKYHPRDDAVLAHIAARVPAAQFLLIGAGSVAAVVLQARLSASFAAAGLDAARHVRFVPPVPVAQFPALLRAGDVYLDSIGWSGGNTTLEAIACGLPVVTVPTGLMRGRHSAAILRHMGLGAEVSVDRGAYLARAVALADPGARVGAAAAMVEHRSRLYGDLAPVRALEAVLLGAT